MGLQSPPAASKLQKKRMSTSALVGGADSVSGTLQQQQDHINKQQKIILSQDNDQEFQDFQKLEPELAKKVKTYDRFRQSYSPLQVERLHADCSQYYPGVMQNDNFQMDVVEEKGYSPDSLDPRVKSFFENTIDMKPLQFVASSQSSSSSAVVRTPKRIGVVLSGGQAPGGHNIICGIFDRAKAYHPDSRVFGFMDGPHGIFSGNFYLLTKSIIDGFRNTGTHHTNCSLCFCFFHIFMYK